MSLLRVVFLTLLLASPVRAAEVTVFAAASLKTALDQIAADWQATSGVDVVISYGGSAALARQIINAAPADLFISAAPEWMDAVESAGLLQKSTRKDLLGNRLVLVAHGQGRAAVRLDKMLDLAALLAGGRLAMGLVDAVPAGQYGKAALVSLGLWDSVKDSTAEADNVRIALQLVALGEAPLGIVYATDAAAEPRVSVIATFPETSHPPIRYPAALLSDRAGAVAFFNHLSSPEAREVFVAQGFLLLSPP